MSNPLIGIWKLQNFVVQTPNVQDQHLLGENPVGYVNYLSNGLMMVQMAKRNRPPMKVDSTQDLQMDAATLEMVKSFYCYCGRYEIKNNIVYHHIELCSFPNWTGKTVQREFKVEQDILHLSDSFNLHGKNVNFLATWQKV